MHCVALEHREHRICHTIHLFVYACFVFTIYSPPPLCSPLDPAATADYTAAGYDYIVDDPTPTVELPAKQSHSLPQISPTFPYFLALGIVTASAKITILFNCIA